MSFIKYHAKIHKVFTINDKIISCLKFYFVIFTQLKLFAKE